MGLRQFVGVLRTRWRFFIAVLVVGLGSATYLTLSAPVEYSSSATLFVSTPPTRTGVTDAYAAGLATQERTRSYVHLASDDSVLRESAARLGNGLSATELEDLVSARFVESTLLLEIESRASSPQRAQQIARVLSDEMLEEIGKLESSEDGSTTLPFVVQLASKASFDASQSEPNLPLSLGTGVLLSLLVATASTVLREVLDTTVKSGRDVQALTGMAPLAVLPVDDRTAKGFAGTSDDSIGASSEAFRLLRTNLQFTDLDTPRQVILVTSPVQQDGKTFVAMRLATAMAKAGRSVLVIDADMRQVSSLPGLDDSIGLGSVLLGTASVQEAVQKGPGGVDLMGSGPLPPNPAEVLGTQAVRDLLATVRGQYDTIVIDAPPLLPVADAAILLPKVDCALVVIRYGVTQREQLALAVSRIEAVGGDLVGVVVNGAPHGALEGYGYGYGPGEIRTSGKKSRKAPRNAGRRVKR